MALSTSRQPGQVITAADMNAIAAAANAATSRSGRQNVGQGETFLDLRSQNGIIGNGLADDTAAINAAMTAASAFGVPLVAAGTFRHDSTITISDNCDLSAATFNYYGSGIAVQVGTGTALFYKTIKLPAINAANKAATGWTEVAGTTGVKILNTSSCRIDSPKISNFEVGVLIRGEGMGCVYNTVSIAHLNNNKINQDISADATGWSNNNTYQINRFSFNSGEGTVVSGTRDIRIQTATNVPNNNVWLGGSVEANTPEYHLECRGFDNRFVQLRWENTGGARVYWGDGAERNEIDGGYAVHQILETFQSGTLPQTVRSGARTRYGTFLPGSAVASTAYCTQIDSTGIRVKPQTGTTDRIVLDSTGKLYLANGTGTPAIYFAAQGTSGVSLFAGNLYSGTDNTQDIGFAGSLRFRYGRFATGVQVGTFATGSRPTAATAGAGCMIFDTTLGKPIWSDGTNWKDATGTTV